MSVKTWSRGVRNAALVAASLASAAAAAEEAAPDAEARRTAVALNYCRSAFHRIRQSPTEAVLRDERQKILNNLDLSSVSDEEVVKLYACVLDEIGQVGIADRERRVVTTSFDKSWQSNMTAAAFGAIGDVADLNYTALVRRGANSWWDFRGLQVNRDLEMWKVEKARLTAIVEKSSGFLDASWKLARKRNIPDAWLVRDADLERLDVALREAEPTVRLRQLARLEPFMACYPPYHYYVGRTQQQLGRFIDAEETYGRLAEIGDGHFRRDEMMAAATANLASIRDYLKMAGAREAAEKSLRYSADLWDVNLTAAMVLLRHDAVALAEEAVLRNLDAGLEREQSGVALLSVYAREGDPKKILARLDDAAAVGRVSMPTLVRCAAACKGLTLPHPAADRLRRSLYGYVDAAGAANGFTLVAEPAWDFRTAQFAIDEESYDRPTIGAAEANVAVHFRKKPGTAALSPDAEEFVVSFRYADGYEVKLTLRREPAAHVAAYRPDPAAFGRFGHLMSFASDRREPAGPPRHAMRVAAVEAGGAVIAFVPGKFAAVEPVSGAVTAETAAPAGPPATTVSQPSAISAVRLGEPEPIFGPVP